MPGHPSIILQTRSISSLTPSKPPNVSVPFAELIFLDIRLKGSLLSTRAEAQRMLEIVAEHNISVKTNPFFGLHEILKLVELAHSGKMAGKGVVIADEVEIKRREECGSIAS